MGTSWMTEERLLAKASRVGDCLILQSKARVGPYGVAGYAGRQWLAHRLAYHLATGEELGPDDVIRHSCDTPLCINREHLTRGTHAQNSDDKVAKRRHRFRESHPAARLTEADVTEIRRLEKGGAMQKDIAAAFNVSKQQVSKIVRNERWSSRGAR